MSADIRVITLLSNLCLEMGSIIRSLDEDSQWQDYWTLDGTEEEPGYMQHPDWVQMERLLREVTP